MLHIQVVNNLVFIEGGLEQCINKYDRTINVVKSCVYGLFGGDINLAAWRILK